MDYNKIIIKSINNFHENTKEVIQKIYKLNESDIIEISDLSILIDYLITCGSEITIMNMFADKEDFERTLNHLLNVKSMIAEKISNILKNNKTEYLYNEYDKNPVIDLRTLLNMTKAQRAFRYYLSWITIFEFDIINAMRVNPKFIDTYQYKNILKYLDYIIEQGCLMDENMAHDLANEKLAIMFAVIKKSHPNVIQECNDILKKEVEEKKPQLLENSDKILYN